MRIRTKGIVIDTKKVADSDVIVTILSEDRGKLRLYANGAKYMKSRLSTGTRLFASGSFDIFLKKELHKLVPVEVENFHQNLSEDLDKFFLGSYIAEFMQKSLPLDSSDANSYYFLKQVLERLDFLQDKSKFRLFRMAFNAKMVRILGYEISIFRCVHCASETNLVPVLDIIEGGVLCKSCFDTYHEQNIKISLEGIKLLNLLLNNTFDYIQNLNINDIILNEADMYLSKFIEEHILSSKLKSLKSLDYCL